MFQLTESRSGFEFRIREIEFQFLVVFCWFSSCVPVDGDSEHQVTLTNTSVKNIRPPFFFFFFYVCFCGLYFSSLSSKRFAAVPLKCDESCDFVGPDQVCQTFCEGMTFAITVLSVLKKKIK